MAAPLALTQGAVAAPETRKAGPGKTVQLDLLAINDFHGQLEKLDPAKTSSGRVFDVAAGGAEYLSTHLKQMRAASRARGAKPITVAAGDLIGATPLLSAAFHDEPSIEAMNLVGLKLASVGNHEFDEGWKELVRLQDGVCLDDGPDGMHNQNSCPDPAHPFEGADFGYLAANVKRVYTGKTILPPYSIKRVGDEKVGFIGMTLQDTPNIVTKEGVKGLRFTDEVNTVNRLVPQLREKGVQAIVVLLHEGVDRFPFTDINTCENGKGPGLEIAQQLHPEVDLVVSGHTHQPYICTVQDPNGRKRLITSAYSIGRVVTEINLQIKESNGDVVRSAVAATNHVVTNADTAPDAAITALIDRYKALVGPIANEVLGQLAPAATGGDVLVREQDADGKDSPLGNLIADSQKSDPSAIPAGGTAPVVALMNPGGIRADLVENAAGNVTYEAAFTVQPFNNYVVSMDLTGQQILDVLNQQWNNTNATSFKVLQVSGLQYTWDVSDATGDAANAIVGDVKIDENGDGNVTEVLAPTKVYRVVVNSFLAGGGDGFPTLAEGANKYYGGLDIDSLAAYLEAHSPYTAPATDRISSVE